jgi:hypothetical protein
MGLPESDKGRVEAHSTDIAGPDLAATSVSPERGGSLASHERPIEPCEEQVPYVGEGRFELLQKVGAGGMGAVYRAVDRATGEPVAVKLLKGRAPADVARFLREARVLSEIEDDAVVRYIAHGREPVPYLVMEWLEGCDLADELTRGRPSIPDCLGIVRQVARALANVHARGVVHRDLKPHNLFLVDGRMDRVKVIDFGIARSTQATRVLTFRNTTVGTPEYMAPEQVRESTSVDARADVFSLGVVLFECLAGRRPFTGNKVVTILAKLLYEETPKVVDDRPEVSLGLQILVERMLSKDPAGRPDDARSLLEDLDALERASERALRPPSSRAALTTEENRLVSVLLVGAIADAEESSRDAIPGTDEAAAAPSTGAGRALRLAVEDTAQRFGGQVDWLRDGSVAVIFDAGGVATDQAERAARCALAIRALFEEHPIALVTGFRRAGRPSPMGDLVRRAAGLLSGAPGAIWIDGLCAGLVDPKFEVASSEAGLALKAPRPLADGVTRTVLGKEVPFVGREGELAMLLGAFEASSSGARAMLVTGTPGVGKSRLREELVAALRGRGEPLTIWIARSDAMRAATPLGLLGDLVRYAAHLNEGEPIGVRREKLLGRVAQNVDPSQAPRVAEFLGEIVAARFAADDRIELRAARQNPMLMADQTRRAWIDLLGAECRAQPVLLVLEDLHWSDRATIDTIDASLRLLKEEPLFVLALARPEISSAFPDLFRGRRVAQVHLEGLPRSACARLSRQLLGDSVTREVIDQLSARAAGNPFLLEELVRARAAGRVDDLPETALAMVQSRLLELGPEARRLLRAASVFGRAFWQGGVLALLGSETRESDVDAELVDLEAREWIALASPTSRDGEREYHFLHDLMREAAYGMLTDDDRRLGNALAGAWLEKSGEADPLLLAECFERGGELRRAATWYRRAAERALAGNDLEQALSRVARGIACGAGDLSLDADWLGRMHLLEAYVHYWRGRHRDALDTALLAMRALSVGTAPWWEAASRVAAAATTTRMHADLESSSRAMLEAGLEETPSGTTSEGRESASVACATGIARAAVANFQVGERARGEALLAKSEAIALRSADPAVLADIDVARGVAALVDGDAGGYLVRMRSARARFLAIGDHRRACQQANNVGNAYLQIGLYSAAEECLRDAIVVADRLGALGERRSARVNLGLALGLAGKVDEGAQIEEEELALAVDNPRFGLIARTYLARVVLATDARRAELAIEPVCAAATPPVYRCYGLGILATAQRLVGDLDAAEATARGALEVLASIGEIEEGATFIHLALVEVLVARGDRDAARARLVEARAQLAAQAAKITDDELRATFLSNVPENARTLALASELGVN